MFWTRLGSLPALALTARAKSGKEWISGPLCSADRRGRIAAGLDAQAFRPGIQHMEDGRKRNQALPDRGGLAVAVLDGHQTSASYLRCCSGCGQRILHSPHGDRVQFYHRTVAVRLLCGTGPQRPAVRPLRDGEPLRPGEEEVAAARRLLEGVMAGDPRAFAVVLGDALYATAPFCNAFLALHLKPPLRVGKTEVYWARLRAAEIYAERDCFIAGSSP